MKVKVKICGIQTLEAAQAASDAGADFLGFNFVRSSKRYIEPKKAKEICSQLRSNSINIVGVFQNEKFDVVNKLVSSLKLDYVQLHGNESPEYISLIQGAGIIKSFSLDPDFDMEKTVKKINKYKTDYILLDREKQGRGELLNLDKVSRLTKLFPVFLAGGLTPENVSRVLSIAKPYAVDVAGGVEVNGKKDKEKIVQFIKLAKNYE